MKKSILFLVGPTAVGKTKTAVLLAQRLGAEIVSLDSMQIYKGMDILTSKPREGDRKKIPHHLIDCVSPEKEYNAYKYYKDALKKIREIHKRNHLVLFAGGTGLYMTILLDGIFRAQSENKQVRERLSGEVSERGSRWLHGRLRAVDPQAAAKIHPNDAKRIIRALEVFESTGTPISELQAQRKGLAQKYRVFVFCLSMERNRLYHAINGRVRRMFDQGLLEEAKRLLALPLSRTARYAIGLQEVKGYLEGEYSLAKAEEMIQHNTRLYAKRQLTWFRRDKRIAWIDIGDAEKPAETVRKIRAIFKNELKGQR